MYLTAAEAFARSNQDAKAKEYLQALLKERDPEYKDLGNTGAKLADEIMTHRRIELWGEGFRWFDLVRLNRLESDLGFERKYNKLPIPAKERSLNKLLNQNSYWAN